jgi:GT2 family glycosyltransferase
MAASPLPSDGLPGRALLGFLAGASVFRRAAFLDVGGYEPRFFIGGEERLLALDLVARGWSLVYSPELTVYHHPSSARDRKARERLEVRNALWTAWLRCPAQSALRRSAFVLRRASVGNALVGMIAALRGFSWVWRRRRVVPPHIDRLCRLVDAAERAQRHNHVPRISTRFQRRSSTKNMAGGLPR